MKVLHLIDSDGLYGAEKVLLTLVEQQLEQRLEPMILSAGETNIREKPLESEARKLGLPLTPWRMRPGLNLIAACQILNWAKYHRYQVLHSHGYKFNILLGLCPRKLRRIPLVTTLHGYVQAPRWSKMAIYETLDRWLLPKLDAVVLVNPTMTDTSAIVRLEAQRLHVIPNGLKSVLNISAPMPKILKNFCSRFRYRFVAVGRLSREKGFDILLKAFARIVDNIAEVGLAVIGEGNRRVHLEALSEQLGIANRVIFPGYIEDPAAYLSNFDCLVIPSLTEGLPITLLEAMQSRIPVVATSVGAIPWVLDAGQCGIIVPPNNVDKLANGLKTMSIQEYDIKDMTNRAFSRLQDHFTAEAMERKYNKVYSECVRS